MLGFSIYLNHDLTSKDYEYLVTMHDAGFKAVFTSLQLPEDDGCKMLACLKNLQTWCQNIGLALVADISLRGLKKMGLTLTEFKQVAKLHVTALRIDDNIPPEIIAKLAKKMPILLNASTITDAGLLKLQQQNIDFTQLLACHNYYPRPETGLDATWLQKRNSWLHKKGLKTIAFIAGDSTRRGPICAGLPTLEQHRNENPLVAMLELQQLECDHVFIGDEALMSDTIQSFSNYIQQNAITLHVDSGFSQLFANKWHNRIDMARDVIRLVEAREKQLFDLTPQKTSQSRPIGTITCDNERYLRYHGEVQITKCNLPADNKVNILGRVVSKDLSLLAKITGGEKIIFKSSKVIKKKVKSCKEKQSTNSC